MICWPKGGGTNPSEVRKLIDMGAEVYFADRLHMKLFWAERRGAIIGSANLTTNALGAGGLKEMVVTAPSTAIDIDKLISSLDARQVTTKALRDLDTQHGAINWTTRGKKPAAGTYSTWRNSKFPRNWKLGWWDEVVSNSAAAVRKAKADFNAKPSAGIVGKKGDYRTHDWILTFGLGKRKIKEIEWLYADFVIHYSKSKSEEHPFEAVQVQSSGRRPPPPFALDASFRKAFSEACEEFGVEKIKALRSTRVPAKLLSFIDFRFL